MLQCQYAKFKFSTILLTEAGKKNVQKTLPVLKEKSRYDLKKHFRIMNYEL